jgi:hypothetical protein
MASASAPVPALVVDVSSTAIDVSENNNVIEEVVANSSLLSKIDMATCITGGLGAGIFRPMLAARFAGALGPKSDQKKPKKNSIF